MIAMGLYRRHKDASETCGRLIRRLRYHIDETVSNLGYIRQLKGPFPLIKGPSRAVEGGRGSFGAGAANSPRGIRPQVETAQRLLLP